MLPGASGASSGVLFELYVRSGLDICLDNGQTETEELLSHDGREGIVLFQRMLPYCLNLSATWGVSVQWNCNA